MCTQIVSAATACFRGRLVRLCIVVFLTVLATSPAAGEGKALVLLPLKGADGKLIEDLRKALAQAGRPARLAALKLDDLMLAVECTTKNVACLQKIGGHLQAGALLLGEASKIPEGQRLSLRWFDVASGGDSGRVDIVLPREKDAEGGRRQGALQRGVRQLFKIHAKAPSIPDQTGGLNITASVPYVEILLNGQVRGTVPLELRNLPVGAYRVEARVSGHATWRGATEVKVDQMTRLEIEMEAQPALGRHPGFLEVIRPRTWAVAGAGALCLIGGIAFGAHMRSQQNEMDEIRGVTFEEVGRMEDLKRTGDRDAVVANVLFGIGGAAVLTAAVLSYLDYHRTRVERRRAQIGVGAGVVHLRLAY